MTIDIAKQGESVDLKLKSCRGKDRSPEQTTAWCCMGIESRGPGRAGTETRNKQ